MNKQTPETLEPFDGDAFLALKVEADQSAQRIIHKGLFPLAGVNSGGLLAPGEFRQFLEDGSQNKEVPSSNITIVDLTSEETRIPVRTSKH